MRDDFTGLVAHYDDGTVVEEKNYFFNERLNKRCATNWSEIDLNKVTTLELYFKGVSKAKISKEDYPEITPQDWVFYHTGVSDLTGDPTTICRNIGYKKDGLVYVSSVDEQSGALKIDVKKY
jgi:hypothetical protein